MRKLFKYPENTFVSTVCQVRYVYPCDERKRQEARGQIGFHMSGRCPDCRYEDAGYEAWGENGHRQFGGDREQLLHWLQTMARRTWRKQDGGTMRYGFGRGGMITYLGR